MKGYGIPQARFDAFRHADSTSLDRINAPMKLHQRRMGHKIEITRGRYTHVKEGRDIAEELDEILTRTLVATVTLSSRAA